MRAYTFVMFLLVTQFGQAQTSSIIVSPIGPQEVYEGARITVYFSTLKHFESIDFTSIDLPDFGKLSYEQNGNGKLVFDPQEGNEGIYSITINAQSENLSNSFSFNLNVLPIDESNATIFYLDPVNGNENGTGTEDDPFTTLTAFLETKSALLDDQSFLFLKDGYHGEPVFTGTRNIPVKILAAAGHTPRMKKLNFSFSANWYLSGLDISPQNIEKQDNETLINVFAGSVNIEITNCKIYAIEDSSVWSTNEDWYEGSGNGILSSGTKCVFRNNIFKNTWFTVEMRKAYNEFSYNIIDRFGGDAIRTLANNQKVNYNQIKNATVYDYDHPTRPQHDDGIQSYTFNNPIKNVTIIGNQVVDIADPNLLLPTEVMQGIVDFDGFAEDWEVTNNLVVTHHAHGIALYGAKNCNVSNNTVTRNPLNYFSPQFKPWIRISPRKVEVGGDHSFGNLVRNNIMSSYQDEDLEPATADHNLISLDYESVYVDYLNWDFRLNPNSIAIDGGMASSTPRIDQEKKLRNINQPDLGCFEKGASLTDREAPSQATNIQFTTNQSSIDLEWEESTDNTGVSHYEIIIDNNETYTSNRNQIQISKLEPGQDYLIKVVAVDDFGNRSIETEINAVTDSEDFMTIHYIPSHRHDQLIKSNQKLMWVGMPTLQIGDYDVDGSDAVGVFPFQLPCIDLERSIVSADIYINTDSISGSPIGELDLYLLEMRSKSDVLSTDYYQGDISSNSSGEIIAEGFIDNQSIDLSSLNSDQQLTLGTELNELYEMGACNKFAFIRLNSNQDDEPLDSYYAISSSDNQDNQLRPLLKIISQAPSSIVRQEIKNGIDVVPNLIHSNEINISFFDQLEQSENLIEIHNGQGQKVYSKKTNGSSPSIQLSLDLRPGTYYITVQGKQNFAQAKFIKL